MDRFDEADVRWELRLVASWTFPASLREACPIKQTPVSEQPK